MNSSLNRSNFSRVCRSIIGENDINTLTTRNLKDSIIKEMELSTKEELDELESAEIEELIDSILFEEMQNIVVPAVPAVSVVSKKTTKVAKTISDSKSKSTKAKMTSTVSDNKKVDLQIKKLKKYISTCGVRKIPSKGLEGIELRNHLSSYLKDDLGMEGQPSLEKCKQIKKKRAWEMEMKELGINTKDGGATAPPPNAIIDGSRRRINKSK